ncbi:MAG TPA: LPS assembly lipoprotein LptE [Gammaproteobacteria bacterium]|nr:LPS assembly lipoprotein LptE [Gammaproteobacteria bacterium]
MRGIPAGGLRRSGHRPRVDSAKDGRGRWPLLRGGIALLAVLSVAACGYHFPGSGAFPASIRSVYLEADPPDSVLARAVEDALRRDRSVELAEERSAADGVLVLSGGDVSSRAAAIDPSGVATEYEVTVRGGYRLIDRRAEGEPVVRRAKGLERSSTYPFQGTTSPAAEEANKRRAGRQAAADLARRILQSIKSGF